MCVPRYVSTLNVWVKVSVASRSRTALPALQYAPEGSATQKKISSALR